MGPGPELPLMPGQRADRGGRLPEGGAGLSGRAVEVKHGTGGTGQAERAAVQAVEQAAVQAFRSNEESGRTKKDILTKEAKFK